MMACERLRNISFEEWNFKSTTLSLIKKFAYIYYPNAQAPIEQVRLEDVLEALQKANQKILHFIGLPQNFDNDKTSPNNLNYTIQKN